MNEKYKHFPACHVVFPPKCEERRAAFYLAAEEYVAETFNEGNYIFTWQLSPTCVFGRNQIPHSELDINFCNQNGIDLCRRKSGGGTIFADRNNIMISLITPACDVESLFAEYAEMVSSGLRKLGAPTMVSGRNDIILEDGRKVCGNAFYHQANRNIVHGTMLYGTDVEKMIGALTPDKAKLESKGVVSVKSRIGELKEYLPFNVTTLRSRLIIMLTDKSLELSEEDIKSIEELEQTYYATTYLWGHKAKSDICRTERIEQCGTIHVDITLRGSLIESITLSGDFFEIGKNVQETFYNLFHEAPYNRAELKHILNQHHPEKLIRNLSENALLNLLCP